MYAVLSDIHGNLFALEKVVHDMEKYDIEGIIMLGDIIDYGMQSNEVIEYIKEKLQNRIVCNLWGNHEKAILTRNYEYFTSQRGVNSAKRTAKYLSVDSKDYLERSLNHSAIEELTIGNKRILAVHGSMEDHYWKSIEPGNLRGDYSTFDFVISGHSHYSHFFQHFYNVDNIIRRNKHAVTFLNPGSVGQPRNHNPNSQYALIDFPTGAVLLRTVQYDIDAAMRLFDGTVDDFYKTRLKIGV